jgi:predicted secreted Zn-dependent protease
LCLSVPLIALTVTHSAAKVTVSERTIHYSLTGSTGKDIYAQIARKGPLLSGQRDHKVATTTMSFDIRNVQGGIRGSRCIVSNVDVHVTVVYRVPKWTGRGSAGLRRAWQAFEAHIWRHEKRHKDIAVEHARRLEAGIKGMTGDARRDCAGMDVAAKRLSERSIAWHNRKQQAFDASWFGDGGQQFKYDRALQQAK